MHECPLSVYKLTASQLSTLLTVLGALVADYIKNPKKPMDPTLVPLTKTSLQWKDLPSLNSVIKTCVRGGDKLSALFELGTELKDALPVFRSNREYTTPEIAMLRALRSYLSTDSATALTYIVKNAGVFKSPVLAKEFAPAIPKSDDAALSRVVQALVGRNGKYLTIDESKMAKETSPDLYAKYVQLRKAHNLSFKASLSNYVRDQHKSKVDYKTAYKEMAAQGYNHSMLPGFQGLIDDQGRWYTPKGDMIGGVPNLATYSKIVMNPRTDPDASWEFKAVKPDGGYAYFYTENFRRQQSVSKYEAVGDLMAKIPAIRAKWMRHVRDFDIESKLSVCAVVLEILYSYAARIGSAPGRGAGTLLVKNTSITTQGVNLAYIGKDSIPTKHIIKISTSVDHEALVEALLQLIGDKAPREWLYSYEARGKQVRVVPADVNKAFREFGAPATVTVHKLRTCRGTALFKQLMDKDALRRPPATEKDAMIRYKEMAEKVGKLLNHKRGVGSANEKVTGTTALTSYIDAGLQLALWDRWDFRPPSQLEKMLRSETE